MAQSTTPRQRQIFVLFLLALLPAGKVVLDPCFDWDTWWHLRVGQHIIQERQLPDTDPFSRLGHEQKVPWIAYSWLYELLLYGSFRAGDASAILILRGVLTMLSWCGIAWLLLNHARKPWVALGLLALVTMSLRPFSPERPWHFTIFFTTLTLHAVVRIRQGVAWHRFIWLPIIYILWANIHIQFVLGFAVLGLSWLATLAERFIQQNREAGAIGSSLFKLGLACSLATLLTPYHFRLYVVIWEYATQTKALALVMELQRPDLTLWFNWPLVVLLVTAAATTALRGYRWWDLALLASAAFFSLRMQRDLWYGVLACSTIILHEKTPDPSNDPRSRFPWWLIAILATAALLLAQIAWSLGLSQGKTIESRHEELYPVKAVRFVREAKPPGPIFNDFDWGGYLIWALPEYPVSMDGRTNLYGEARLQRSMDTWQAEVNWDQDPDLLQAGIILAPKRRGDKYFPLTDALQKPPSRWRIVYEDEVAVVFVPIGQ